MPYTVDGTAALESRIAGDMTRIREAVLETVGADAISALILGGGYGRSEGGVYLVDGEERVYNDYDFFVVVPYTARRRRKELSQRLETVKQKMEPACGIHVDFSPPMPLDTLADLPYELMFMEVRAGYKVIYGPENALDTLPDYDQQRPPLEEGARLLMNRGMGLFLAAQKLGQTPPLDQEDHEFVVRNIYKAIMAMGDGVLFLKEGYNPSYVARLENFLRQDLVEVPEAVHLRSQYKAAMDFKLRPQHDLPADHTLESWHQEIMTLYKQLFLWFEQERLKDKTLSWEHYCALSSRLPELSSRNAPTNLYRNMRTNNGRLPSPPEWFLHPRDRILKRLPQLLWGDAVSPREIDLVMKLWQHYG